MHSQACFRSRSLSQSHRLLVALVAPLTASLLLGACAEPTVDEIRDQAQRDLNAMLRHGAKTLDDGGNRKALNAAATRGAQLIAGEQGSIDLFGDLNFSEQVEHLIVELDARAPKLFTEANVIADIDNGKRFRFAVSELCAIVAEAKDCDDPELTKIALDLDVTLDGDSVRISVALAGKAPIGSLSISADHLAVEVDGAKALAFVQDVNTKLGQKALDLGTLKGSWRVDLRRQGSGLRVEARLQNALLEQELEIVLDQAPTVPGQPTPPPRTRMATLRADVPDAGLVAILAGGSARVESDLELRALQVPVGERDLAIETGALSAVASSDGSGPLVLEALAAKPVVVKLGGKTALSATLDRDGKRLVATLAAHGTSTSLTLKDAARPRVEVHPEVFDDSAQPFADAVVEAELSAGLSLLPRRDGNVMFEVLAGKATLKTAGQSISLDAGQCMHSIDTTPAQPSLLDFMQAGSCPPQS
jgi:hypothetical protein